MDTQNPTWQQKTKADTETWERRLDFHTYGIVSNYQGTNTYCWQAVRGDFRLSGVIEGADAGMTQADATLDLPIDEYNARVANEVRKDLLELERKLLRLLPDGRLLPGYHAGYEAGMAETKRKIEAALS